MLIDVLTRLSKETGIHPTQKRSVLISLLQDSAREMHKLLECTKIYREVTLVVQPNKVVTLPAFIGELRGMRMHTNELPFDVNSIAQPRYISTTLAHKFKNWRDKGESAVFQLPNGYGRLKLQSFSTEPVPVNITISGQTANSNRVEETIVWDDNLKQTTNLFGGQIYNISCVAQRQFDITISDYLGNQIAVLYNDQKLTRYKIVDVSQIFWTLDTDDGGSLIDVLYKLPATDLFRDTDSFYAGEDYDEAWFCMGMYFYLRAQQNRMNDAIAYQQSASQMLLAAKDSSESGIMKKLQFGRNKCYGLFRKYRYFPGSVTSVDHNTQG